MYNVHTVEVNIRINSLLVYIYQFSSVNVNVVNVVKENSYRGLDSK